MKKIEEGKPGRDAMIRFIRVQNSGICNMLSKRVQQLAVLTDAEHHYIIAHYPELCEEYNISTDSPEVCGYSKHVTVRLTHIGRDSWNRPVYQDEEGKLWKDTDPRAGYGPKLCSVLGNSFDGEPDTPMAVLAGYRDCDIEFTTERDIWGSR